jgi:hypothetical protein
VTAPIIPAGAGADLAALLLEWRTIINAKIGGGVKVKTADTSRASTTTFSSDPHLVVPVLANTVYSVDVQGVYFANAAGQLKLQATFPAGATFEAGTWGYDPGTDEWAAATTLAGASPFLFVTGLVGGAANIPFRLTGSLHVGATAGSLDIQWAQTTSNASATILRKGSWMRVLATT